MKKCGIIETEPHPCRKDWPPLGPRGTIRKHDGERVPYTEGRPPRPHIPLKEKVKAVKGPEKRQE